MARRLEALGGTIVLRPTDPNGVRKNYYVEDPDGNWIELMAWGSSRKRAPPGGGTSSRRGSGPGRTRNA